ncbi:hypothetical protein MUY27_16805 [Mucilaginibacter sp. RS28]|uniref:Uncharacterized protein n=1 Tax=Mucilaginibacter straminoryzae TaxID=2932774 RepID=A0A9X2BB33_9SPHI|nr:hypothetical protein [Mucilaginibacter straminoryzae]MCJ8211380.1 hypothetical protein [Mucilaginibacter straminoryzae]
MNNSLLKTMLRYVLYVVTIPVILLGSFELFINHPEVQLAFWVPGIVLIAYSVIRDDFYARNFKLLKGK